MSELHVGVGAITVMRLFDAAYAIDLARVEALAATSTRCRLQYAPPKAISFGVAPVEFSITSSTSLLSVDALPVEYTARIYDFGVVSILGRFAVNRQTWNGFVELSNRVAAAAEAEENHAHWQELLDRVLGVITPAMERPTGSGLEEDYLIASVQQLEPPLSGPEFIKQVDLVPVLSGEARALAPGARNDLLRHTISYYEDDLVALTWDRAFVLEPGTGAASDIDDVLEVANAQLLELRYYDELLDAELPRMYSRVDEALRPLRWGRRRYAKLARELHRLVAEVTEITERIDNALKVTEDVYLARVYGLAVELFRVRTWGAAVDRKLSIVRDTYSTLYDEAATARAELLEVAIVLLIVLEIVLAFVL